MLKFIAIFGVLIAIPAGATVIVNNTGEPTRNATTVTEDLWAGQSFQTDGTEYILDDIWTILGEETGSPAATAELRANTPTGLLLTTFLIPPLSGPLSVRTLTPVTPVALAPNSTYWLTLAVNGPGSFLWAYAEGNNWTGPGTILNYAYSYDEGDNWEGNGVPNPYQIDVNGTALDLATPEPATFALAGLGLLLVGLLRNRQRF